MGCGHSKINIYPRKSKSKRSSKKSAAPEKTESEEEDGIENETENAENQQEDCDNQKKLQLKPVGGPLLAHVEISTSQQDFFRMLDEKIENGPDYNSESESEQIAENFRIRALLKDWETASAGSRSLPNTPKLRPAKHNENFVNEIGDIRGSVQYNNVAQMSQSVIHQSYGVALFQDAPAPYTRQHNNPHVPPPATYPSALQYQAISPLYGQVPAAYPPAVVRQYPSYNQCGSPIRTYSKHHQGQSYSDYNQDVIHSSAAGQHKILTVVKQVPDLSNGDVTQQPKPIHHQRVQYQQYNEGNGQTQHQHHPKHHSRTVPAVTGGKTNDANCLQRHQYEMV